MPINFTEDEEEASQIDFTPDPAPAVAPAPRPIIPPSLDERAARRAIMASEIQKEAVRGQLAEATANRFGIMEEVVRPFASTAENPLGGIGSAVRPVGAALNLLGGASANAAKDFLQGVPPTERLFRGAPAEREGNIIQEGLTEAARMVPTVAGSMGLMAAGVPPVAAFSGPMAAQTFDSTEGDIGAAIQSGAVGAVLPGVGEIGRKAAVKVLGKAVDRGLLSAGATTTQKVGEAVGAQVTTQALMEGMNIPAYIAATPEERKKMFIKNMIANTAFSAMDVPGIVSKRPSATQEAAAEKLQHFSPLAPTAQVMLPETMKEVAKAPAMPKAAESVPETISKSPEPAKAPTAEEPSRLPERFRDRPVTEIADLVKEVTSEEIAQHGGGATGFMWDVGAKAKTPEDVAALRKIAEDASVETRALMDSGDLAGAMKVIGRQPAEAYEYATGVKIDGTPKWDTFEKFAARKGQTYRPPVPDAQYVKAKGETAPAPEPATPAAPLPDNLPALARLRATKPELRTQIDAKIDTLRAGAQSSPALKELPPVPAGHVRLFHGEGGAQGGGTGGAFYTSNIAKASTFGPDVSWVDLPTAKAQAAFAKAKASSFGGGDNFILEPADISRSRKINQKVEQPTHVLDEPAAPPASRGIAASVREPGALGGGESGAVSLAPVQAAVAGAKAARDTVGNVVRFYSEPLTERLASEGGTNAKGFANMSNEIAQRSKELFGSLTPTLDPALEATGRMNRTTTWLNDIAPTNQKWGYRNAVKAVEGLIGNVPADHVGTVNQLKAANLAIGQLPQGVVPGYRASGRYQRPPTASFVDAIRSQKGPVYETAMQALASENRMPVSRVKEIFKDIKAEFDQPGAAQTVHKIAQEFQRQFKKFPTDLKITTPMGEMWVPILHAKPFDYLLNSAQTTAQRIAFLERVPRDTLPQLRKDVVAELKDPAAFDELVRALHGLPVNEPLRLFAPGTMQEMIASGANRVLTDVFSSLKLTASAIYNIPETVLGNTPAFFGWRNFLEGAKTLKERHDRLETLGAINRAIYNFSIDPKAPVRSTLAMFRQGVRKSTAQQFFNEMQEMLAASTAQVFSERAQGRVLSAHEQALFTETATAMGFKRPAANSMARGAGTSEQYGDFVKRAASFATGGNVQPAELSRFGANRVLNGLFRFQSYPIMKLNAFRKAYVNLADAVESKDARRIKASSEQMAKFLFNTTAQGAATAFVAALLTGRGGGIQQVAEDAAEEPGKFIFDSVASGIGGPVAAINYAVGTGRAGDLVNPKNLNAGITFPGSIYLELKQLFNTEGPYEGMSLKQAAKKYSRTKIPAGKMINRALEEAGLISGAETSRNNLFRLYDKWLGKQTDPKIKADYERNKGRVFGDSKYDALDAALADKDEARAIKAIGELKAEGQKPRDIMDRMRPFVGEGINSRAKPLFHGSHKLETQFRNSLNPEQKAEYQKALAERKATYQEFLKAWRKRGSSAPTTAPKIDFVPDAGQ